MNNRDTAIGGDTTWIFRPKDHPECVKTEADGNTQENREKIPSLSADEVGNALTAIKNDKAPDSRSVIMELLKGGPSTLVAVLFSKCLEVDDVPK